MPKTIRSSLRTRLTVSLLALLIVVSGCKFGQNKERLTATGTVEMTEISVSSKIAGQIVNLPVNEGELIRRGDLIAELDHEALDAQIAAAEANLQVAQLRYQKTDFALKLTTGTKNGNLKSTQIELAKHNLEIAQTNFAEAERNLKRIEQLRQQGLVPEADYETAVSQRQNAATQCRVMEANLTLANTAPSTDDVDLTNKQAAAQIRQAQTSLDLLKIQLRDTRITAPADGVFADKLIESGELVSLGMVVGTVLDYTRPWVQIYLPLMDLEKVTLNQKAYVTMDAYPKRKFSGRVSFISQQAEFTPKDFQTKEERVKQVYAVKIELENSKNLLKAGIPVDVVLELKEQ